MPTAPEFLQRLDRAFDDYRRNGDLEALGRVFDATAQHLVLLAERIVGEPHLAQDVLQRTFVTAIEKRDSWDARRPLWPWLTGILAREAQAVRRNARRMPDAMRLGAPGVGAPPDDALCRRESVDQILRAIEKLGSAYREVLVLHLVHGLQAGQIATALGLPGGTVRSRITRGLARLREALPAALAVAWLPIGPNGPGSAGLEGLRHAVLKEGARAAPAAGSLAAAAAGAATGLIATTVMSKTKITVAGVALALLGLFLSTGPTPSPGPSTAPYDDPIPAASAPVATPDEVPLVEREIPRASAVGPRALRRECMVTGRILDPEGRPVPNAEVRIVAYRVSTRDLGTVAEWNDVEVDAEGSFAVSVANIFDLPPAVRMTAKLMALVRADRCWPFRGNIGEHREPWLPGRPGSYHFDITLMPYQGRIVGRVVDPRGVPVEGADLHVSGPGDYHGRNWREAGSFVVHAEEAGTYRIAASHPEIGVTPVPVTVAMTGSAEERDVGDLVLRPAIEAEGTLRMADGTPAAHVAAHLRALDPDPTGGYAHPIAAFVTDESGHFRTRSLARSSGGYSLIVPYLHSRADPGPQEFAFDPAAGPAEITLAGQHLTITARDPEGNLVGDRLGIQAWLPPDLPHPDAFERLLSGFDRVPGGLSCSPQTFDGRMSTIVATGSVLSVSADAVGCLFDATWHQVAPGVPSAAIDLVLQAQVPGVGGRIRFDVRDERGAPIPEFGVRVTHTAAALIVDEIEHTALDPGGLTGPLPPGRLTLVLRTGPLVLDDHRYERVDDPFITKVDVLEGQVTDVPVRIVRQGAVRLDITRTVTDAWLQGIEVSGAGAPGEIEWDVHQREPDGSYTGSSRVSFRPGHAGPVFAHGRTTPGPVTITVAVPGQRVREIRADVRPHEVTVIPIDLDDPSGGR